ncbi:MAG: 3-deoxy-D-manno-octulosonic acid transferase [Pelagibacteraceae bacterium]
MLSIYRFLTFFLYPIFILIIFLRVFFKKENKFRYKEKIFSSSFNPRKDKNKKLIWFHASSIGELLSIMPLIDNLNINNSKNLEFLVTTVTLSSAELLEKKLLNYNNVTHRFFPLDTKFLVNSFLNNWQPNLICFIDSEIWPNFLFKIKENKIPLILLNARITKKTLTRWKVFSKFAKKVFDNFDLCLASSNESKKNLELLGVKNISYIGNLKFCSKAKFDKLNETNKLILNDFNAWCAASTHKGEEEIIIKAHINLREKIKNLKTIIIPRHITRVSDISSLTIKHNLTSQILNDKEDINKKADIIIVNSFGVLEKYYDYCKNVFVGKSMLKKLENVGGQNPIEPAKLGCKIFHGPYVYNFKEIYEFLNSNDIAIQVHNEQDLSSKLLESFEAKDISSTRYIDNLEKYGDKILIETISNIKNYINIY